MTPPDIREAIVNAFVSHVYEARHEPELASRREKQGAKVLQWLDTLPAAPAPDWSSAPSWAMWWAMDSSGHAYWYSEKPRASERYLTWESSGDNDDAGIVEHENWRTTLHARPTDNA